MYSLAAAEPYDRLNQLLRRRTSSGRSSSRSARSCPRASSISNTSGPAHERGARRAGVAQEVIDVIKHDRPTTGLPEKEATAIEFGRAMLRGNRQVPPELFAKMVSLFGDGARSRSRWSWATTR